MIVVTDVGLLSALLSACTLSWLWCDVVGLVCRQKGGPQSLILRLYV